MFQVGGGLMSILDIGTARLTKHGDTGKAGAEVVVNILGDSGAFFFQGTLPFQLFHSLAKAAAGGVARAAGDRTYACHDASSGEPPCLPKLRQNGERKA